MLMIVSNIMFPTINEYTKDAQHMEATKHADIAREMRWGANGHVDPVYIPIHVDRSQKPYLQINMVNKRKEYI